MRTERQRRERQMLDIAKARNAKAHEFDRARKVAEVTARLRLPPKSSVPTPPWFDDIRPRRINQLAQDAFLKWLAGSVDKAAHEPAFTRYHDDVVDASKYASAPRLP